MNLIERRSLDILKASVVNESYMTMLPSPHALSFRPVISDKKAILELARTNFSAISLRCFAVLVLMFSMLLIVLEVLL